MVVRSWTGWRREERAIGKLAVIDQAVRSVSGSIAAEGVVCLPGLIAAETVGQSYIVTTVWPMSICIFILSRCREGAQLCGLGHVAKPLHASVSSPVKWGCS